ncbi:hypothetical protein RBH26_11555 [Natronolimnohabitans sp. A-GB9]|uniref:DUF4350 domain-containing protein n=1 Tax=Natronolimnohabitans sp. A-GB9 TaxID=3069757 RepID=UPI0027B28F56|nr:DUF4350 domain-containing protein [Natronolimnohabitans sp. A-GB9]MDQ2051117.1 hypothetical protein [Natronolimnohabitans sp. A-GB9]
MSGHGRLLAATFVVAFVLTVGLVSVGTVVVDDGTEQPTVEREHFQPEHALPDTTPDGGEIAMDSSEPANDVVIHTGDAMAVDPMQSLLADGADRELSTGSVGGPERSVGPLTTTLVENGHAVEFYADEFEDGPLQQSLADADAFVTTAPDQLTNAEQDALEEFADAGGRVLITADPGSSASVTELGSTAGIHAEPGYLYNLVENDNNYLSIYAEPEDRSPLTADVETVVLRSAAVVETTKGERAMTTAAETRLSTTREADAYSVAAHDGDLAVIGDSSFLEPENAYRADNNVLIGNVADFLVTGEKTDQSGPDEPSDVDPDSQVPDDGPGAADQLPDGSDWLP